MTWRAESSELLSEAQDLIEELSRCLSLIDEEDILLEVVDNPGHFDEPVAEAMESHLVTVSPDAPLPELVEIFKRGMVAIVVERGEFLGLITPIDLLNWLRLRRKNEQ